jgi:CheY-like chemotaxis protein
MAKVLLVEDDNNLREIYQARLMAEGYTIVAAQDGEEALVLAKKEHPDLIISDVMMPRISGFEMLDILRNTDELKHTKVIMLTALGQAEDQTRADNLGADKYLVKSQVTLEDIVKSAEELLGGEGAEATTPAPASPAAAPAADDTAAAAAPAPAPSTVASSTPVDSTVPAEPTVTTGSAGAVVEPPAEPTAAPAATPVADPPTPAPAPDAAAVLAATPASAPATPVAEPAPAPTAASATSTDEVVVPPPAAAAEPAHPAEVDESAVTASAPQTLQAEEAALEKQINNFADQPASEPAAAAPADATANDDAVLAQAVEQLNTPEEPAAETPPAAAPAAVSTDAAPVAGDAAPVAGKKIIQPISNPAPGPSLDELLAKEAAKEPAAPPTPVVDGNPTIPKPQDKGFDPNSISL